MTAFDFERHCAEIVTQTSQLADVIEDADMTAAVPSCPGWNVGQLVRHLGGGQRWCADMVRQRAAEPLDDSHFRDLSPYASEDSAVLRPWLVASAADLAAALTDAGPHSPVSTGPVADGSARFYARRFAYETLVHRADATLALGVPFRAESDVMVDALDEWMWLGSLPMHFEFHPWMRELLGAGRTLHFHATDDATAEWVVDLTGDAIVWRRAHEKCAVAVRGPLVDLLLVIYKRKKPTDADIEILGDRELFEFWLERLDFG